MAQLHVHFIQKFTKFGKEFDELQKHICYTLFFSFKSLLLIFIILLNENRWRHYTYFWKFAKYGKSFAVAL